MTDREKLEEILAAVEEHEAWFAKAESADEPLVDFRALQRSLALLKRIRGIAAMDSKTVTIQTFRSATVAFHPSSVRWNSTMNCRS